MAGSALAPPREAINWGPCPQPAAVDYHALCGTLSVPVDSAAPEGPAIDLALLRIPATGKSTGTVVADSEDLTGFGGSQLSFFLGHGANYLSRLPRTHATKDIVVFDPRGLGGSAGLTCPVSGHDPMVSSFPATESAYDRLLVRNAAVFFGCHGATGLASHMGIRDQVRDLDALRSALGQQRLDYLGQVVGGEVGAAYAATYPARTGRVVLDATVDPYRSASTRARDAASAEETAFEHFADWCAQTTLSECALHGQDAGKVLDQVVARADRGGVSDGSTPPRPLTGAEIRIAVGQFLVGYPFAWSSLAGGIAEAANSDGSTLAAIAAMTYSDPDYTASRAQTCADSPAPAGFPQLRRLAQQVEWSAPHTGGVSLAWEAMAGCVGWHATQSPLALPGEVNPTSSILITATTGDPISPYAWSRDVADRLDGSRLITADLDGHGAFDDSTCAAAAIDRYLADGTLPAAGTVCHT
ncbi:MAG TPA: alpha/beta fold hydrolase [Actinocrinis sp.]|jgi:pimeloyl-ACP methyl ester carboxylesterase|uniref:alpha/beta fold hydrolase n=1 Tax=Actinocrinis sp. TaxID=1920516 RepID=UPI002DDC9744|nr:alpha/beta fold hydrolase [Actinocrinis sp.]HEV3173095.1 alpha/beta fold hydrolase [Actinocrinis sp.]